MAAVLPIALGLGAGAHVAYALSKWWTPANATGPTFASEERCEASCRADQNRCDGSTDCTFRTGETRPSCY
jgi:hypothetical protein